MVHHHTTPRTYIFPGGSPTFATITLVAAAFVRATHVRPFFLPSLRGGRKPRFVSRTYISSRFLRRNPPTSSQQSGAVSLPSRLFREGKQFLWLRALSNRDQRYTTLFARGFYTGHVYHVGRDGGSTCCCSCPVGLGEQARR